MIVIEICVGSSCHVKGSNQLIGILKEMIKYHEWEAHVVLKGVFCMQRCLGGHGLGISINQEVIEGVGLHNAKEVLYERIVKEMANG